MKNIAIKEDFAASSLLYVVIIIIVAVIISSVIIIDHTSSKPNNNGKISEIGATTFELQTSSYYILYLNVSDSQTNISTKLVTIMINNSNLGTMASPGQVNVSGPDYIESNTNFTFKYKSPINILELVYDGYTIYNSGTINFKHNPNNIVIAVSMAFSLNSNDTVLTGAVSASSKVFLNSQISFKLILNNSIQFEGYLSNASVIASNDPDLTLHISNNSNSFIGGSVYKFFVVYSNSSYAKITTYDIELSYQGNIIMNYSE